MTSRKNGPINGVHSSTVAHVLSGQIEQTYDRLRAHDFWVRLIAGDNDPKEIADGICQALGGGYYVRKEDAVGHSITIQVLGNAAPEDVARTVSEALSSTLKGASIG